MPQSEAIVAEAVPSGSAGISSLIVKIAERCNLNCSYCYMYHHADRSYLDRPALMSDAVYDRLLDRMAEYCARRPGHRIALTFHGGEPALVGARRLRDLARRARERLGSSLAGLGMQTNATLIDSELVRVLAEEGIRPGVSMDGPAEIHDSARVDHQGRGSHAAVEAGFRQLQRAGLAPGILCVINPGVDGLTVYRYFRTLEPSGLNFLFPDATHDSRPFLYGPYGPTPVADYLIPIFDDWFRDGEPDIRVRIFHSLLSLILGGEPIGDAFGNPAACYLVVDTDGSIQALDALKACEVGIAESGLNVVEHGFDDLRLGLPLVHRFVHEGLPLPTVCGDCPEKSTCAGGYLPHRYSRRNGFDNPSVWCADILKLMGHIRGEIEALVNIEIARRTRARRSERGTVRA